MNSQCDICEEVLPIEQLESHKVLHDAADRVVCRGCGTESETVRQHRQHAQQCFNCPLCRRNLQSKKCLFDHECNSLNEPFTCACGENFRQFKDIVQHAKGPNIFHCCSCDHTSTSFPNFKNHALEHEREYECPVCAEIFSTADDLKTHRRKEHRVKKKSKEGTEQCEDCGKYFKANRMEAHRLKHKLSSCLCPECGKMFSSHCRLSQHLMATHYAEPVTCDICQKVLKTKKILAEHLKTHWKTEGGTRVAQAVCPRCGLELAQKGSLARHITLVHERHRLKKDETPRTCKECSLVLPTASQYYSHIRQHRAAKERFPCEVCGREFNKKQNLIRHISLVHNKNRPAKSILYACDMCGRKFLQRCNLTRHYRVVHKVLVEELACNVIIEQVS